MIQKDPVCGMQIGEDDAAATSDFGGKTYFFCSTACQEKFDEDPTQYANQAANQAGN